MPEVTPIRILIVGGTGGVGDGIVRALLARRDRIAGIAVSSRDGEKLARFHGSVDRDPLLRTFVGSVGTTEAARELRDAVRAWGGVDVVIASIGGWWVGPELTEIDDTAWSRTLDTLLTLTRALVAERGETRAPLICELVVDGPVSTSAPHHGPQTDGETTAREVGDAVAGWVVRASLQNQSDAFDWPSELLETSGPITIMRRRKK